MATKRKRHQGDTSWIELATKKKPKCAVPVLPRFQADVVNLTGNSQDSDSSKWLGKRIWPLQGSCNDPTQENNKQVNGEEGESGTSTCTCTCTCTCQSPGSVECVKLHVAEERNRLKRELGPAFEEWEFDQMGEEALNGWSPTEEDRFEEILKRKQLGSQDALVQQPYWKYFRNKDKKSLVSYLFNVYIPRKFARETRACSTDVCTDDDDDDDDDPSNSQELKSKKPEPDNNSQKRPTPSSLSLKNGTKSETAADERSKDSSKSKTKTPSKNKYMAGFR